MNGHILLNADPASFRDPAGTIYKIDNCIYRTVLPAGAPAFEAAWQSGVLKKMAGQGRMIEAALLPAGHAHHQLDPNARHVLSHPLLPCITYPYEWPFAALRSAALAHIDLQLALLDEGFALSDASAFNMQFIGAQPVHIDTLSVIPYREGMPWNGYRQFLQHFLNPLVLEATTGVSFAPFFRATLDGISSTELARLLPWHARMRMGFLLHVMAPAWGERCAAQAHAARKLPDAPVLPKKRYRGMLQHLRAIIASLQPNYPRTSPWHAYTSTTSYAPPEAETKSAIVRSFVASHRPALLLDLGCNKGDHARLALEAGAKRVIGLDADRASVDAAFQQSALHKLPFTPLVADLTNPSPAQGWQDRERSSLTGRIHADALIALALIHHLCIAKNIPLPAALAFIVSLAPHGLIEFVPKSDPQVVQMLRFREDIFPDYGIEAARAALLHHAHIIKETPVGSSGRIIFEYERKA